MPLARRQSLVILAALGLTACNPSTADTVASTASTASTESTTAASDTDLPTTSATTPGDCGNDIVEAGEACDGADLGGAQCADLNPAYTGGTLVCGATNTVPTDMSTDPVAETCLAGPVAIA